ncbi:hypothetical protein ACFOD4_00460 [Pseudoroseomonas globiformis]|uniref:Uncharacterized protein n=1 Tax=Teichococcus globiformis TaxID=2307229 RepID=A0ABV7FWG6_9PROT
MSTPAEHSTAPPMPWKRCWRTIRFMAARSEGAFSEAAIRAVIYRAKPHYNSKGEWVEGNGLAPHICQPGGKGGKILIDEHGWDAWLERWIGNPPDAPSSGRANRKRALAPTVSGQAGVVA